jgi:heme-degrading monooxygenase HmoA
MHGRTARYTYSGDALELARAAEDGILPIFQGMPGFKAYSILANDSTLISFSAWESAEEAEEASKAVASWVAENMADKVQLIDTQIGEIYIATALGVSTKAGITS